MIKLDYQGNNIVLTKKDMASGVEIYTLEDIVEHDGQQLYKIRGYYKPFVRSEILLVEDSTTS